MHIGIDTGTNGCLVALSDLRGVLPISLLPMPMMKVAGKPQVNTRAIVQWMLDIYAKDDTHLWIEKCPNHMPSVKALRSVAIGYGKLLGIFEARFPHVHIHRIECGQILAGWQRQLLGTFNSENSKQKALELARKVWPAMEWPTNRNGRTLDGGPDAALLAEFGRCTIEREPLPQLKLDISLPR